MISLKYIVIPPNQDQFQDILLNSYNTQPWNLSFVTTLIASFLTTTVEMLWWGWLQGVMGGRGGGRRQVAEEGGGALGISPEKDFITLIELLHRSHHGGNSGECV